MHCRKCGIEILDKSNFCNLCGTGIKPIKNQEFIAPWIVYGLYTIVITILSLGRVSIVYQDFLASIGLRTEVINTTSASITALARKPYIPLYEPNYIGLLAYIIIGFIITYCVEKAMAHQT